MISIHKALAGLDGCCTPTICALRDFNPQGPRGPRPNEGFVTDARQIFQSTRPSRASTLHRQLSHNFFKISIHKALAGLDPWDSSGWMIFQISIHKALAGLDALADNKAYVESQFQSTRPSRASTVSSA